jgi:transcriptional regulator with XRE-family HTH domain
MTEGKKFVQWLDQELARRGWSDNQLAKKAYISHSVLSKARRGTIPRWDACQGIASALNMPAEVVFRAAGLLPAVKDGAADLEEWQYLLDRLPEKDRYELLQIARLKLSLQEKEK